MDGPPQTGILQQPAAHAKLVDGTAEEEMEVILNGSGEDYTETGLLLGIHDQKNT